MYYRNMIDFISSKIGGDPFSMTCLKTPGTLGIFIGDYQHAQ